MRTSNKTGYLMRLILPKHKYILPQPDLLLAPSLRFYSYTIKMNTTFESYWLQFDSLSFDQSTLVILILAVALESILPGSSAQTKSSKRHGDLPGKSLVTFRTLNGRTVLECSPESSLVFR